MTSPEIDVELLARQGRGIITFGWIANALGYGSMWAALTALLLVGCLVSLRLKPARAAAGARA